MFKLLDDLYDQTGSSDLANLLGDMNPLLGDGVPADSAMHADWLASLNCSNLNDEITEEHWRHAMLNFLRTKGQQLGMDLTNIVESL